MKRFVFLVHPLVPAARRLAGLRTARPRLALGQPASSPDEIALLARVGLGEVEGWIVGIPLLPEELLADQERALAWMERAVQIAAPVQFVGLGSVLAVVAGRGGPLQERCGLPVTTGNAATVWAAAKVAETLAEGRPIAVHGAKTTVGRALVARLGAAADPQDLREFPVVVGAHTTGGSLDPAQLAPGSTLVDVALPRSLRGPAPQVRVVQGESVALAPGYRRDLWGHAFHLVAGYGLRHVYACLLEPMLALRAGRDRPFAQGRSLAPAEVDALAAVATEAGFHPAIRTLH